MIKLFCKRAVSMLCVLTLTAILFISCGVFAMAAAGDINDVPAVPAGATLVAEPVDAVGPNHTEATIKWYQFFVDDDIKDFSGKTCLEFDLYVENPDDLIARVAPEPGNEYNNVDMLRLKINTGVITYDAAGKEIDYNPADKDSGYCALAFVHSQVTQPGWNHIVVPLPDESTYSDAYDFRDWNMDNGEFYSGTAMPFMMNRVSAIELLFEPFNPTDRNTWGFKTTVRIGNMYLTNNPRPGESAATTPGAAVTTANPNATVPPAPEATTVAPETTPSGPRPTRIDLVTVHKTQMIVKNTIYSEKRGYKGETGLEWFHPTIGDPGKDPINASEWQYFEFDVYIEDYAGFKAAKEAQDAKFVANGSDMKSPIDGLWLWFRVSSNLAKDNNEFIYRYEEQITKAGWNHIKLKIPEMEFSKLKDIPTHNEEMLNGQLGIKELHSVGRGGCDVRAITSAWWTIEGASFPGKFEIANFALGKDVQEEKIVYLDEEGKNPGSGVETALPLAVAAIVGSAAVVTVVSRKKRVEDK